MLTVGIDSSTLSALQGMIGIGATIVVGITDDIQAANA